MFGNIIPLEIVYQGKRNQSVENLPKKIEENPLKTKSDHCADGAGPAMEDEAFWSSVTLFQLKTFLSKPVENLPGKSDENSLQNDESVYFSDCYV